MSLSEINTRRMELGKLQSQLPEILRDYYTDVIKLAVNHAKLAWELNPAEMDNALGKLDVWIERLKALAGTDELPFPPDVERLDGETGKDRLERAYQDAGYFGSGGSGGSDGSGGSVKRLSTPSHQTKRQP